MIKIIKITLDNNIDLLKDFILKIGTNAKLFRYYNSRPISIIKNHLVTLLLIDGEKTIAYGHLDKEKENIWLGICVLPEYTSSGYGKKMMDALLEEGKKLNLSQIVLTVDKDNCNAISLYEKMRFYKVEENDYYYKYRYNLER